MLNMKGSAEKGLPSLCMAVSDMGLVLTAEPTQKKFGVCMAKAQEALSELWQTSYLLM